MNLLRPAMTRVTPGKLPVYASVPVHWGDGFVASRISPLARLRFMRLSRATPDKALVAPYRQASGF